MPEMRSQSLCEDEVRLLEELARREPASGPQACPPHEHRKYRRYEFFGTLTARRRRLPSDELDPPVTVDGRDFSLGGLQFVSSIEFPPKSQLELFFQLQLRGDRRFVRMLAEVRHATENEDGQWITGCKFLDTLAVWPR
jgi:hypothetical protein